MQQHSEKIEARLGRSILLARSRRGVGLKRRQREGGYLLLAIMLMMAFMVITLTYVVGPAMVQQIKRDREAEMIHRGTEYARAIKKFYKKNSRYPSSLDDLDKGQIRFLRKRYADPLAKDGKWKLLRYGDIQTLLNTAAPGVPAGALNQQGGTLTPGGALISGVPAGGTSSSSFGSLGNNSSIQAVQQAVQQQQQFQNPGTVTGFPTNSSQGSNQEGVPTNNFGFSNSPSGSSQQGSSGSDQQGGTGGQSNPFGSNQAGGPGGNQVFGGGAIVGVASVSKEKTIRIYNKKKTYDEWQFIYNPAQDQQNVLLRGPYQPTTIGSTSIGTPAGQLNGQQGQQNNPFGQQNNGFGQPTSGFGQQNNPQSYQPLSGSSGQTPQQQQ
jgi:type II secretory pathway pseudopilin PulG